MNGLVRWRRPYDLVVIGGGIVGLATARAYSLRYPRARIALLEAERELARHQTGNNSGVIHAGLYYKPGSRKAEDCVRGREWLEAFLVERGIPFERCGKLVVATKDVQRPALTELARRGAANGLDGIRELEGEGALRDVEPHVRGVAGLWVPQTGIVDYAAVARAIGRELRERGVALRRRFRVERVDARADGVTVSGDGGEVFARQLINCGGLHCDRIARLCGVRPTARILPFRGEYYRLVPEREGLVRNLIYPVPDPRFPFLGVHLTRMIGGGVEAGPNAVLAWRREGYRKGSFDLRDSLETVGSRAFWSLARRYWRTGLAEVARSWSRRRFVDALRELVPGIEVDHVIPAGAGVRAQAVLTNGRLVDDFLIERGPRSIHVLNAPSPAATASLAIGDRLVEFLAPSGSPTPS